MIGKVKNVTTLVNSSSDINSDTTEEAIEPLKRYQCESERFMSFLIEALHLLEEGCEITSTYICTKNKGKLISTLFGVGG